MSEGFVRGVWLSKIGTNCLIIIRWTSLRRRFWANMVVLGDWSWDFYWRRWSIRWCRGQKIFGMIVNGWWSCTVVKRDNCFQGTKSLRVRELFLTFWNSFHTQYYCLYLWLSWRFLSSSGYFRMQFLLFTCLMLLKIKGLSNWRTSNLRVTNI